MGGAYSGAVFLNAAVAAWLVMAGLLVWILIRPPCCQGWERPAWFRYPCCGVRAALGATIGAIVLGFAVVYFVYFTLGTLGSASLGIVVVLPLLVIVAVIVSYRNSKPSP